MNAVAVSNSGTIQLLDILENGSLEITGNSILTSVATLDLLYHFGEHEIAGNVSSVILFDESIIIGNGNIGILEVRELGSTIIPSSVSNDDNPMYIQRFNVDNNVTLALMIDSSSLYSKVQIDDFRGNQFIILEPIQVNLIQPNPNTIFYPVYSGTLVNILLNGKFTNEEKSLSECSSINVINNDLPYVVSFMRDAPFDGGLGSLSWFIDSPPVAEIDPECNIECSFNTFCKCCVTIDAEDLDNELCGLLTINILSDEPVQTIGKTVCLEGTETETIFVDYEVLDAQLVSSEIETIKFNFTFPSRSPSKSPTSSNSNSLSQSISITQSISTSNTPTISNTPKPSLVIQGIPIASNSPSVTRTKNNNLNNSPSYSPTPSSKISPVTIVSINPDDTTIISVEDDDGNVVGVITVPPTIDASVIDISLVTGFDEDFIGTIVIDIKLFDIFSNLITELPDNIEICLNEPDSDDVSYYNNYINDNELTISIRMTFV